MVELGVKSLAPWEPPQHLVIVGLYRYTRNPMYIAVLLIISAAFGGDAGLHIYAIIVAVGVHPRVRFGEESWLARTHGAAWCAYASRVPRWFW